MCGRRVKITFACRECNLTCCDRECALHHAKEESRKLLVSLLSPGKVLQDEILKEFEENDHLPEKVETEKHGACKGCDVKSAKMKNKCPKCKIYLCNGCDLMHSNEVFRKWLERNF